MKPSRLEQLLESVIIRLGCQMSILEDRLGSGSLLWDDARWQHGDISGSLSSATAQPIIGRDPARTYLLVANSHDSVAIRIGTAASLAVNQGIRLAPNQWIAFDRQAAQTIVSREWFGRAVTGTGTFWGMFVRSQRYHGQQPI